MYFASKSIAIYSAVPLLHGTDWTFSTFPISSRSLATVDGWLMAKARSGNRKPHLLSMTTRSQIQGRKLKNPPKKERLTTNILANVNKTLMLKSALSVSAGLESFFVFFKVFG